MNKKLLNRIKEIFKERLQVKTGWGRNDVLAVYEQSVADALMEMLDE